MKWKNYGVYSNIDSLIGISGSGDFKIRLHEFEVDHKGNGIRTKYEFYDLYFKCDKLGRFKEVSEAKEYAEILSFIFEIE